MCHIDCRDDDNSRLSSSGRGDDSEVVAMMVEVVKIVVVLKTVTMEVVAMAEVIQILVPRPVLSIILNFLTKIFLLFICFLNICTNCLSNFKTSGCTNL